MAIESPPESTKQVYKHVFTMSSTLVPTHTMASEFCSSILAAVTNWLPGPRILSTLGQLAVPQAMAATACTMGRERANAAECSTCQVTVV